MSAGKMYSKAVTALKAKVATMPNAPKSMKNKDPKTGKRSGYGGKTFAELHAAHKAMKK